MPDFKHVNRNAADPPWKKIHLIADRAEPELRRQLLETIFKVGGAHLPSGGLNTGVLADAILKRWEQEAETVRQAMNRKAAEIMRAMAEPDVVKAMLPPGVRGLNYGFNLTNPKVWEEINQLSKSLLDELNKDTQAAITEAVRKGFQEGLHPYDQARLIRGAIGLTPKGVDAVANYRKFLEGLAERTDLTDLAKGTIDRLRRSDIRYFSRKGLDAERINLLTDKFRDRLVRERAENFTRTATMQVSNGAQRSLWTDAQDQGFLEQERFQVEAITTPDDWRCPNCRSMNGKRRELDGTYKEGEYTGSGGPIWHWRCRCCEGLVEREGDQPAAQESIRVESGKEVSAAPSTPLPKLEPPLAPVIARQAPERALESAPAKHWLETEEITGIKDLGGGTNASFKVTFANGKHGVFKPVIGEDPDLRLNIAGGTYFRREVAAWEIADAVGMQDLVPRAVVRWHPQIGSVGSVAEFWENAKTGDVARGNASSQLDIIRSAVFDLITGNTDRHGGNWMIENRTHKLRLIDHGLILPTAQRSGPAHTLLEDLVRDTQAIVPSVVFDAWKGKWSLIQAGLERAGIEKEAIGVMQKRYNAFISRLPKKKIGGEPVTFRELADLINRLP